jgi:hypothetical protein
MIGTFGLEKIITIRSGRTGSGWDFGHVKSRRWITIECGNSASSQKILVLSTRHCVASLGFGVAQDDKFIFTRAAFLLFPWWTYRSGESLMKKGSRRS